MKKKQTKQFPRNYREIPEYFKKNPRSLWLLILFVLSFLFLICSILFIAQDLYKNYQNEISLNLEINSLRAQENFWISQKEKYPQNRDINYNLAVIEYRLGDYDKSFLNAKTALSIDPEFKKGKDLIQKIEGD